MAAMRVVGAGHQLPAHANVREDASEYVIELDVADFTADELTAETFGRRLTVRGEQVETAEDDGKAFRLQERLEESFRLPDDADLAGTTVRLDHGTLRIHAPRTPLEPRPLPIERPSYLDNHNAQPC
jgi:HSP20 family molecular chaperone IbpA